MSVLEPGTKIPEISLVKGNGEFFTTSDFDGKTTILVFYPFAFSPVCTDQFSIYEEVLDDIAERGAVMYGVSCDSMVAQTAFIEKLGVTTQQLSDFEPKGAACKALGVLHPGGFPERALMVVGPDSTVSWSWQADSPGELPGANLLFEGLDAAAA